MVNIVNSNAEGTDSSADRSNRKMVDLLWDILPLYRIHGHRILARKTKDQQRPCTSGIPPSKTKALGPVDKVTNHMQWLLNRDQRARYDPNYQNPSVYYNSYPQGGAYGMHPMPPPMYDPNAPMPPTYQPPAGASKVDPSQWRSEPTRRPADGGEPAPDYSAPVGPPPTAVQANHTGASTASNNPYRL